MTARDLLLGLAISALAATPVAAQPAPASPEIERPAFQVRRFDEDWSVHLLVNYQITRHLLAYVGYSHFFAGEFIDRAGPGRDSDFFYAAAQYTF